MLDERNIRHAAVWQRIRFVSVARMRRESIRPQYECYIQTLP